MPEFRNPNVGIDKGKQIETDGSNNLDIFDGEPIK